MTPLPEDFWPETMTRDGDVRTRACMAGAWASWGGEEGWTLGVSVRSQAIADSMLQRARKAGHIRFEGGKWVEVTE